MKKLRSFSIFLLSVVLMAFVGCQSSPTVSSNSPANVSNLDKTATPAAAGGESKLPLPESVVAELYKAHDGQKSPFFQTKDRALVDKYFTKALADLIWKESNNSSGEVGALDGDPLYNAQDTEIKNFAIGKGDVKGETSKVTVTFTNFGQKQSLEYSLKLVENAWKIDNIGYGGSDSLKKWLEDTYSKKDEKTKSPSGKFEGKYIVGTTSCVVKPVKMAFEVRWAKGSGVEMFFAEGDNTFTSNPDNVEPNDFIFDDDKYDIGTFYRADGTSFSVKRAN